MSGGKKRTRVADLREPLRRETPARIGFRDLVSIEIGATVRAAVRVMQEHRVGCIVVLDGGKLAGIFTERSLLVRVLGVGASLDTPIAEVMTPDPVVAQSDEPIHLVLSRMLAGEFRHVPVVSATGEPLGTMSIKRAVHFLTEYLPEAIYNLAADPESVADTPEGG